MKDEFRPGNPRTHALCAVTGAMATAATVWGVVALVTHYDEAFLQLAKSPSAVSPMRAQAATTPRSTGPGQRDLQGRRALG